MNWTDLPIDPYADLNSDLTNDTTRKLQAVSEKTGRAYLVEERGRMWALLIVDGQKLMDPTDKPFVFVSVAAAQRHAEQIDLLSL